MTVSDDPILCPECGATPTVDRKRRWTCANCWSGGPVMGDGMLCVRWRYRGLDLGDNAVSGKPALKGFDRKRAKASA